jgi:RNA polymerase sigma-70 factor (ECF subfamily)
MEIKEVIEGCIKNKRKYQEVFYKMFYGKLMGVSLRMSPNEELAKDFLQESFIKIFNKLHMLDKHEPQIVYSWCKRILTNTIIDHYRKNKHFELSFDDNFDTPIEDVDDNYLESKNIDVALLIRAIQKLSPQYNIVFNLYIMEGYSHQEISNELQISIGTSKSNLSKAKANLRKELELC